ncbi:NAD-dependent deacylase [Magnetococcales bacterium HHB-1]
MKRNLVVLTGAGISAESGIPTFRSNGGLWKQYRFEELATPEAFAANPELVWQFYQWRQKGVIEAKPNDAHRYLADLEEILGKHFHLITQNVDDLHERAGQKKVLHMHGEIRKARCLRCHKVAENYDYQKNSIPCLACGGKMRPHIVWFGEMPFFMDKIHQCLSKADLFLAIGTSGAVYPAAQFVHIAKEHGAKTFLINLDAANNATAFDFAIQGDAAEIMAQMIHKSEYSPLDWFDYHIKNHSAR